MANTVRVAVEGCVSSHSSGLILSILTLSQGHGTLNAIYASIKRTCEINRWDGVDLLIIGGDFQAVRNAYDLNATVIPPKYREMGDFHEYYSGQRRAPYLTLFIGGNHEASNHLFELYYGGWVAPNIYYLGASNLIRFGPLRIAALSGIWKGYSYKKPHFERIPYSQDDVRSAYHVREIDTRKLLQISSQVDIGLSHDWPRGMEWKGDWKKLFRRHAHLEPDARDGTLGNVAAKLVLDRLRPHYWFSAHFHVKFSAIYDHEESATSKEQQPMPLEAQDIKKEVETGNPDEIDLDMSEDGTEQPKFQEVSAKRLDGNRDEKATAVPKDLRDQLPASFQKRAFDPSAQAATPPADVTNRRTRFLALDKCLPRREFLQVLEIKGTNDETMERPYKLAYDKEWLAITRTFAPDMILGDPTAQISSDKGNEFYKTSIKAELEWVEDNLVKQGHMTVPENFEVTAPIYDPAERPGLHDQGKEYTNPQTAAFCHMLEIPNPLDISEEERQLRISRGPAPSGRGGGGRGRGQGRGRGRGR